MPDTGTSTQTISSHTIVPVMVSKRKQRKSRKKKKGKKRSTRSIIRLGYSMNEFLPATSLCNHRYSDRFQLDANSGIKSLLFNINDAYNPNPALGAAGEHRPYGSVQMEHFYKNCVVVGGTYEITFSQGQFSFTSTGVTAGRQIVGACIGDINALPNTVVQEVVGTTKDGMFEEGIAKYKNFKRLGHLYSGQSTAKVTGSWSTRKLCAKRLPAGSKSSLISATEFTNNQADGTPASPAKPVALTAFAMADGDGDIYPVNCEILLNYKILWFNPKVPDLST